MPLLGLNISRSADFFDQQTQLRARLRSHHQHEQQLVRNNNSLRTISNRTRTASSRYRQNRDKKPLNCLYSTGILHNCYLISVLTHSPAMAIFINQAMFFLLCDKVLLSSREKSLTALYSLLFYNVGAYLLSYGKEIIDKRGGYQMYVNVSDQSNVRHLSLSATKIVLDLVKFVTFAITCVFIILVFGVPGHNQFNPTWCYVLITLIYYGLTDPWTHEHAYQGLRWLQMDFFENLESLWTPVIIRTLSSAFSGALIILAWFYSTPSTVVLIAAAAYVNVYLCLKEVDVHWRALLAEKTCLDRFSRYATSNELTEKRDDVCAVCLLPMQWKARVTVCKHFFHSECLRLCLKAFSSCPICKQPLVEEPIPTPGPAIL